MAGERTREQETRLGKRIAAVVIAGMVVLAMYREITLWRLIELKMELLVQCVPAFLLALHWGGLRARPVFAGLVCGSVVAVSAVFLGATRVGGFHVGVLSLVLNLVIAVTGSWLRAPGGRGQSRRA